MTVFKCKICGGSLSINSDESVAVCEYCGTQQTLPRLDDDKRVQLYDRANYFRRENEFDKAMGIYEMILSEDKEDYEAYWGIVLCRYGIQYVKDPHTSQRIPTVNRSQFTSIYEDKDFLNAIKYSNESQREIFKKEAYVIDKIQKRILEISSKEEPFDVFICYKETDKNGNRTQDSVYAQDIYNALTKEGYKVFFSRITLEDKLGSAYEPYIFAALNSARVMLVVGTERDNFNAVWVKNEWSRFLSLIKAGKDKTLIPVYKDMSPYDMPEEFQYLQSQDMGKIGFMQDLIHGIKKLVEVKTTTVQETVVVNNVNTNTAPLLKRAFMFLEDGDFARADEFCEQVLNLDPECAEAYLGKLLVNLRLRELEDLGEVNFYFNKNPNYQKAYRFADDKLKVKLDMYENSLKNRLKEKLYVDSVSVYNSTTNVENLLRVAEAFKKNSDYKDSQEYIIRCYEKAETIKKDNILSRAKGKMVSDEIYDYEEAIELLETIPDWKDAGECISVCEKRIEEKEAEAKLYAEKARKIAEERERKRKKLTISIISVVAVALSIFISIQYIIIPTSKYNKAIDLMNEGSYREAIEIFYELKDYKDSKEKSKELLPKVAGRETVSTGYDHTVALKNDGTVVAVGDNEYGQCDVSDWTDIIAICAGDYHTVGLKSDGTVVAVGKNDKGQCDVSGWKNIVAISVGYNHTVGLRFDGTVVAVGPEYSGKYNSKCDVSGWKDIVAISAGEYHTVGLKVDGTVVAVGDNDDGQCD